MWMLNISESTNGSILRKGLRLAALQEVDLIRIYSLLKKQAGWIERRLIERLWYIICL